VREQRHHRSYELCELKARVLQQRYRLGALGLIETKPSKARCRFSSRRLRRDADDRSTSRRVGGATYQGLSKCDVRPSELGFAGYTAAREAQGKTMRRRARGALLVDRIEWQGKRRQEVVRRRDIGWRKPTVPLRTIDGNGKRTD